MNRATLALNTRTFGNYIAREAPSSAAPFQGLVEGPSGIDRKVEVIAMTRSFDAAVFFARACAGASPDELKEDPFMAPEPATKAPEPIITEGQKF